ncbi:MAG: trans-sulfuration enzyme family protein [Planctomycetia bacterium]
MPTPNSLPGSIHLNSVFPIADLNHLERLYSGEEAGFIYARDGHPNSAELAAALAEREGAEAALVASSGMAAIAAVLLDQLKPGDVVAAAAELYGKTLEVLGARLAAFGVVVRWFDARDPAAVESACAAEPKPKLVFVESLSNPLLNATDVGRAAAAAHAAGALLVVDSTFTPPPLLRPIDLGADLVVHSLTKILSGHADVTLGSVAGRRSLVDPLRKTASAFGSHAAAFDCWLTLRGLATFDLRLERSCENARRLAALLPTLPGVGEVYYPALGGFMTSFEMTGGRDAVDGLFRALQHVGFYPSLGDVKTTVSYPAGTSHRGLTPDERRRLGITAGLVRVSVGIEPWPVIEADFRQAASALG